MHDRAAETVVTNVRLLGTRPVRDDQTELATTETKDRERAKRLNKSFDDLDSLRDSRVVANAMPEHSESSWTVSRKV